MNDKARILAIDDEPHITLVLRSALLAAGYDVRTANEGESALDLFHSWKPNLVICDLSMPGLNGIEVCRRIRLVSQVPIIVLSVKQEEKTKVEALDAGADDYVTKPFGIEELLARVRAALRRAEPHAASDTTTCIGDFVIDVHARTVQVCGRSVHLTPKEFDLLLYFVQNAGRVLTHKAVLNAVWGKAYVNQSESLRVYVGQLRKKLEFDAKGRKYILTEPWIGYRFVPGDPS
jgi:two-component system KDP operon response regulator KdpE